MNAPANNPAKTELATLCRIAEVALATLAYLLETSCQ